MLTCRQATQLLSERQEQRLTWQSHTALNWHLMMCRSCRRFGQQIQTISQLSKQYKHHDDLDESKKSPE